MTMRIRYVRLRFLGHFIWANTKSRKRIGRRLWEPIHRFIPAIPTYPVEQVSWNDCQAFIARLNTMGVGTFRLPTEAEWEYACRAGTSTRYYFGDALECSDEGEYCISMDQNMWWEGNNTYGSNMDGTKEVGLKAMNGWGLHDMSGNVFEWCSDYFDYYPSNSETDPVGPSNPPDPEYPARIIRGGSYYDFAIHCRSAFRGYTTAEESSDDTGFRILRLYEGATPTSVLPPTQLPTVTWTPTTAPRPSFTPIIQPSATPTAPQGPQHRVLFINVTGINNYIGETLYNYDGDSQNVFQTLQWANANVQYLNLSQNGQAASLMYTNAYDQIWVFDLSFGADNYPDDWNAIAAWYANHPTKNIICDSRMILSYTSQRYLNEGFQLTQNIYANLLARGGGLVLGTDNGDEAQVSNYHHGINTINSLININPFFGAFDPASISVDRTHPLMTAPNNLAEIIYSGYTIGQAPSGLQPNGLILYTAAWRSGDPSGSSITTTIAGNSSHQHGRPHPVNKFHRP